MRIKDCGSAFRVYASKRDVEDFASRWPCFGTRRAIWFEFHKASGGLQDVSNQDGMDGAGVVALSQDCYEYARKRCTQD